MVIKSDTREVLTHIPARCNSSVMPCGGEGMVLPEKMPFELALKGFNSKDDGETMAG